MLLQFTVENFKSFDGPTPFVMRASKDKDHPNHVIGPEKFRGVKAAAIYGANAAGKSNLVAAMAFARDLIVKGRGLNQAIPIQPFALRKGENRPSGFHWQWAHEGQVWSYGFDVTRTRIVEEYLFSRPEKGGKEKKWFERKTDEKGKASVEFGPGLVTRAQSRMALRLEIIAENLRANQPFLTHGVENQIRPLDGVFRWMHNNLKIVQADQNERSFLALAKNEDFSSFVAHILRFADTGICGLVTKAEPLSIDKQNDFFEATNGAISEIDEYLEPGEIFQFVDSMVPRAIHKNEDGHLELASLLAIHKQSEGEMLQFPFEWESEGTRRLLHLAISLYQLRNEPTVLVIDELDRRLHTLLAREFVKLALDSPSQSQLIFTTHDTNLLDSALLRRDEIWFVNKDERGASSLRSLVEYKVRSDANYEKGYLFGAFEGIPYFGAPPASETEKTESA